LFPSQEAYKWFLEAFFRESRGGAKGLPLVAKEVCTLPRDQVALGLPDIRAEGAIFCW